MNKLLILFIFFLSLSVRASHISGGQITYQCLGNNVYQVKLTYFWDCEGGFNPGTSQTINVDGCGTALTVVVNQSTLTPGDGVSADGLCPNSGLTTCKKRIEYIGNITLPSACNNWVFSIGSCCRGGNITNISGGTSASYYHMASLNNTSVTCNNSPDITIGTLPNFCVNQPACFNLGATEVDGHTLSYAFVAAYQTATTFVTYNAGYTGGVPITGITIDPATGQINFTPTTIGDFVITVQITEKDANGNIIGTIMRDFQVIVTNCSNQTVTCGQGAISNVTSGTAPSGNTLQICENIPFCFDVTFTDPNVGDSVKISSPNMSTTLPGSSMVMTYTPGTKNKVKATICWTPPAGSSGLNTSFVLVVKDNACPVPGTQVLNYFIDVLPATSAGPDRTICGSQSASVTATGSSTVFAWSDLAGTPVPVGPAFSCNPCKDPVIKPAVTSTYVVTNVGGGANCKNKDTIVVNVVPDFTLTANVATASGCLNSAVQFTSNVSPAGSYSYSWSPAAPLTSTNTANTSAIYSTPGNYNYTLTAISSIGCTKQSANIAFTANPVVTPQFTVVPTNTTICNGAVPLSITFGSGPPATCALATSGCAVTNTLQVGSATTEGSSGVYSPYGGVYDSQKNQYLFRASELLAAGIVGGKLNRLAFKVTNLNFNNTTFENFTIKMKCVSYSTLPTTTMDNTGLVQVFNPTTINATLGWNTYNFTQAYEWDGISNLLVDVCYFNPEWDGNLSVEYSTMAFTASKHERDDDIDQCALNTVYLTGNQRPNVRFGNCSSTPPASSFTYSWSPAAGLSSTSVSNPTANISANTVYTVVVTPTAAATCSNVGTTSLTIVSTAPLTISAVPAKCSNASSFSLSAQPAGGTWSLTATTTTAGVFTPSLAAIGNNTVTYMYGGAGCMQTATAVVTVERFVPSTISGTINPICLPSSTINLSTALSTSTLGTGVWSGNGVSGTIFNPNTAGGGTHTLTYSTNSSPTTSLCPSSSTIAVSVVSTAQPTITAVSPMCSNAVSFSLSALPAGGTWSLTASTSTTGVFTPSLAAIGNNTITYIYGGSSCLQTATAGVSVERYLPSTITGTINPLCLPSSTINLSTALTTSTLGTGVWSGNGVTGTIFNPNAAGVGTHTLTYSTNSSPTASLCPSSSTTAVMVNAPTQPTLTSAGPFCTNAGTFAVSAIPTGGTWTGVGLTPAGVLTPSTAVVGSNTYSYTVGSSTCSATNTLAISVEQYVPSTITGFISPLCISDPPVNLSAALSTSTLGAGVWSGNGVLGTAFNPANAGAAVHTLTYSTNSSPTTSLCPSSSTINITVNSVVQPTVSAAGPFCDNSSPQQLTAVPSGGVWSPASMVSSVSGTGLFSPASSSLGTNKIYYTLTNAPCSKKDSVNITVIKFIPATITGALGPYCIYNPSVNLQPTAQFSGGVWSGNGVTGSSFSPTSAGAGNHTITYKTDPAPAGLCPDTETLSIIVNAKPNANAVPNTTVGCTPVSIDYSTSTVNLGTAIWDFGDGTPRDTGLLITHIYYIPGTYTATLYYTDPAGCKDTTVASSGIKVNVLPVASFEPSVTETTVVDGLVEFTNQSTVLADNTYAWDIEGLYNSTQINESFLFANSGNYVVTLTATTIDGCTDDTSVVIKVNPDVVMYVPNVFTPGADGLNDVFQIFIPPSGADYSTYSILIYDRWGELVFQSNDILESWTGARNNSGAILPQGTYVWKIHFQDEKRTHYEKMGHVTILHK
ncbi:MAG: PKD domain-containing protein [Bacteroidota bacterium]